MKLLTIQGSLRKNGNTEQAVQLIHEQLRALAGKFGEPLEIEQISLGQVNIEPCRGCRVCFDRGEDKCPHHDDMPSIRAKMLAADAVLIASPIYVDDVNGSTKTFIDRMAYACHRPAFAGKVAYALVTVAGSPTGHALGTLTMALRTWGFYLAGQQGWKMGALMKRDESRAAFHKRAEQAAAQIFSAVREKKYLNPSFLALMMFAIQQAAWRSAPGDSVDYRYWRDKGWVDHKTAFYLPHRANPVRVTLARMAGALIQRFVT